MTINNDISVCEELYDTNAGKYKITTIEPKKNNFGSSYNFNVGIANIYGVNEAIFINNLVFWIKTNESNKRNFIDGFYWSFNTNAGLRSIFPFWSTQNIRTIIKSLISKNVIKTGKYNKKGYDRTLWYTIVDLELCNFFEINLPFVNSNKCHLLNSTNAFVDSNTPIPDIKTKDIKKDILSESAPADSQDNISSPKKEIDNILEKPILDSNIVTLEIGGRKETYDIQDTNSLELELNKNIEKISKSDKDIINLLGRIYLLNYLLKYKSNFRNNLYPRDYKNIKTMFLDYGKTGAKDLLLYSMENWKDIKSNLKIVKQIPTIDLISKHRQEIEYFRQKEIQAANKKQGEW